MYQQLIGVVMDGSGSALTQDDQPGEIAEGEYGNMPITVYYQSGAAVDLTGLTLVQTFRKNGNLIANPALLTSLTASAVDLPNGKALFELHTSDTEGYPGAYVRDVFLINPSLPRMWSVLKVSTFDVNPALYHP